MGAPGAVFADAVDADRTSAAIAISATAHENLHLLTSVFIVLLLLVEGDIRHRALRRAAAGHNHSRET